jgi:ribosomal protein S18 acetylase RimI-like enzyme
MDDSVTISEARPGELDEVRRLFRAYAATLPFDLAYQGFEHELAGLPQPYAAPQGVLLVARERHARILGTVGVKRLAEGIAEIKRLYVTPAGRGRGLGQALLESAIASAARLHYSRVRLDSHRPSMTAAIALYRKLGFAEIEPYGAKPSPDADMCFFERALPEPAASVSALCLSPRP